LGRARRTKRSAEEFGRVPVGDEDPARQREGEGIPGRAWAVFLV